MGLGIPPKVDEFGWQIMIGGIAVKQNLHFRGCLQGGDLSYSLCGETEESIDHLFLTCHVERTLWGKCMNI